MINPIFQVYLDGLDENLQEIQTMECVKIGSLPNRMPKSGVYVFYENNKALYVGQSKRLKDRIKGHSSASKASLAARIARLETKNKATYKSQNSINNLLLFDKKFKKAFEEAKNRIKKMEIKFVEEVIPIRRTILEMYVATILNTPYNDFDTH